MRKIKYSFEDWCNDNNRRDLLDLWDYELNNIPPSEVSFGSEQQYWFKCPRGLHESLLRSICGVRNSGEILCKQCHTFGLWLLDNLGEDAINKYWSKKNECSPFDIQNNGTIHIWAKHTDERYPDYWISIRNFIKQRGLPKYNRKIVVKGVNDIATTHPEYVQYFVNKEDVYRYSHGCTAYSDVVCPICGHIRNVRIDRFTRVPFSCPVCGDNVSYPNKFVREFFNQLQQSGKVIFDSEKVFDWSKNLNHKRSKRTYDFYLSIPREIIVEAHGAQHYDSSFCSIPGARTLEEEKLNDIFKYNLAVKNGFTNGNYVVLDCRKSSVDWIKSSIMNSVLPDILQFTESDIDWVKCDSMATSNYTWIAAQLWNSGMRSTSCIATEMQLNQFTIQKYLKKAHVLGWCDYDADFIRKFGQRKPILCVNNNVMFASAGVCEEVSDTVFGMHLKTPSIKDAVRRGSLLCGLSFKQVTQQEFITYQNQFPNMAFGDIYLTLQ